MFSNRGRGRTAPIVAAQLARPLAGSAWFSAPSDNPALDQANMSSFSPTTSSDSPHASAPIPSRITAIGRKNQSVWVAGHGLDDITELHTYGASDTGANLTTATKLYRSGNIACFRLASNAPANAFFLAWLYHPTYLYSEPLTINAPQAWTLHTSFYGTPTARVGDTIRVGGINLSSQQSTERCWAYISPTGGGAGTWVACATVSEAKVTFTLPSLSNGTYYVWIHTGRGGAWGWSKCGVTLTVASAQTLQSDYNVAAPSGGDDKTAIQAGISAIGNGNFGYAVLQAGTYLIGTQVPTQTGGLGKMHIRGQGVGVTIIKPMAGFSGNLFDMAAGGNWIQDLTVDLSEADAVSTTGIGGFARITNVKVIMGASNYNKPITGWPASGGLLLDGCELIGGASYDIHASATDIWICPATNPSGDGIYAKGNTFRLRNYCDTAIWGLFGGKNLAVENNHVYDVGSSGADLGRGRLLVHGYRSKWTSVTGNTTHDLGVGGPDQNKGEQILSEGGLVVYVHKATGGTATTILSTAASLVTPTIIREQTNLASSNATSGTPSCTFLDSQSAVVGQYVKIISGTNAIPGTYLITGKSGSFNATLALSGGPIGSAASISNVTCQVIQNNHLATNTDLASSNATSSTPTVTSASLSSEDIGRIIYVTAGTNAIVTAAKITAYSGGAVLDRAVGTNNTLTGCTFYKFEEISNNPSVSNSNRVLHLAVVGGKGVSQMTDVTTTTTDGTNIIWTLDRSLRVATDSTSLVHFSKSSTEWSVYGNTLSGDGNNTGASCGFEIFNPGGDQYFWNNSVSGVHQGVVDWAFEKSIIGGPANATSLWNYFADNTVTDCNRGTRQWGGQYLDYGQDVSLACSVWANMDFATIKQYGFWVQQWNAGCYVAFDDVTMSFASGAASIVMYDGSLATTGGNAILSNCSFSLGSGTFSGSRAVSASWLGTLTGDPTTSTQFVGFQSGPP